METASLGSARRFTPEEAEHLLPALRLCLAGISELRRQVEELLLSLSPDDPQRLPDILAGHAPPPPGREADLERLKARQLSQGHAVEGLATLGVTVHDLELGLIDFPTMLEGRDAVLCWQQGEASIEHFHGISGGEERIPLPHGHPVLH